MTRTAVWLFPDRPAPELVALAGRLERAGIEELWLGDEGPARDPFAVLAAIAVRTKRLRLGIGVTNPYLRLPAVAAASALTLQELSGGRVMLGFGTGGGYALDPVGVRPRTPFADTERALLTAHAVAEGVASDGYTAPAHAIPPDPLPLYVGSRGKRLNRFAGVNGFGAFVGGVPVGLLGRVIGWTAGADVALCLNVAFDEDDRERRRPGLVQVLVDTPAYVREHFGLSLDDLRTALAALRDGDEQPARALIDDEVLDDFVLHGSEAEIAERITEIAGEHRPTSVGIALLGADPGALVDPVARVLGRVVPA